MEVIDETLLGEIQVENELAPFVVSSGLLHRHLESTHPPVDDWKVRKDEVFQLPAGQRDQVHKRVNCSNEQETSARAYLYPG